MNRNVTQTVPDLPSQTEGADSTVVAQLQQMVLTLTNQVMGLHHSNLIRQISQRKTKDPVVLFFGRDSFSDNSKYLYLHAASSSKEDIGFVPIWCTYQQQEALDLQSKGLRALCLDRDINRTLQVLLSASVAVFCVNPQESLRNPLFDAALEGSFRLQLWHGVGTKRLDLMQTDQMNLLDLRVMDQLSHASSIDAVLSPCADYDSLWRESFGAEVILRAGLPRNEVLLREPTDLERMGSFSVFPGDKRPRVLFAPTFTFQGKPVLWRDAGIFSQIRKGLERCGGGHLYIKPHPFDRDEQVRNLTLPEGVTLVPAKADIYPALREFDLVISDKSSLVTDFLLVDKPVILLDGEREDVRAENPYTDIAPGLVTAVQGLAGAIEQALKRDAMGEERRRLRERIFPTDPLSSCAVLSQSLSRVVAHKMRVQKASIVLSSSGDSEEETKDLDAVLSAWQMDRGE